MMIFKLFIYHDTQSNRVKTMYTDLTYASFETPKSYICASKYHPFLVLYLGT